jgi:hypothetical protein
MPTPTTHTTRMEGTTKAILKKAIKTSTTTNITIKAVTLPVSNLHTHKMATGMHVFLD